jgi:hypothetical protein
MAPTDEELDAWIDECAVLTRQGMAGHYWVFDVNTDDAREIVRAALDRWGSSITPTPEQWEAQKAWAVDDEDSSCILELRARVEALEAAQQSAPAPLREIELELTRKVLVGNLTLAEATERLAKSSQVAAQRPRSSAAVEWVRNMREEIKTGSLTPLEALKKIGAPTPAPTGSLVERVMTAGGMGLTDSARAAIREVSDWLRDRTDGYASDLLDGETE